MFDCAGTKDRRQLTKNSSKTEKRRSNKKKKKTHKSSRSSLSKRRRIENDDDTSLEDSLQSNEHSVGGQEGYDRGRGKEDDDFDHQDSTGKYYDANSRQVSHSETDSSDGYDYEAMR